MSIRFTLIIAFVGSFLPISKAQSLEFGGFIGVSNYLGDLQQTQIEMSTTNFALGIFTRANLSNFFSIKAHFYKGEISGSDANFETLKKVRERNLSFRSQIYELGIQGEFSFLYFGDKGKRVAAPYLFAGISGFHFNPQAQFNGKWVDLQPLGTEGQGTLGSGKEKYSRLQIAIPLGVGFNINFSDKMNVGFEVGFRKTFTDYLDDVSGAYPDITALEEGNPVAAALSFRTPEYVGHELPNPQGELRGNPKTKDMYLFAGITFSAIIAKWLPRKKHAGKVAYAERN